MQDLGRIPRINRVERIGRIGKIGSIKRRFGEESLHMRTPSLADATTGQRSAFERISAGFEVEKILEQIGDRSEVRLARRIVKLKDFYPYSSLPELITIDWLLRRTIPFEYQGKIGGGRRVKGGLVPDFVVSSNGQADVWEIQGEYWHSRIAQKKRDALKPLIYIGQKYNGLTIKNVIFLWEFDIYRRRPLVFEMALAGVSLRR